MLCIAMLMISVIAIANEVGIQRINPWLGIAVCIVLMWGSVKLIDNIPDKEEKSDEELYHV